MLDWNQLSVKSSGLELSSLTQERNMWSSGQRNYGQILQMRPIAIFWGKSNETSIAPCIPFPQEDKRVKEDSEGKDANNPKYGVVEQRPCPNGNPAPSLTALLNKRESFELETWG